MPCRSRLARLLVIFLLPGVLPWAAHGQQSAPTAKPDAKKVRAAVERGLVFLENEGLAWLKNRKCISCHHGPFMLWSHREALQRGLKVERGKLDAWTGQELDMLLAKKADMTKAKNGGVETMHLLLAHGAAPRDDKHKTVAALLINAQRPDGSWKYEGQGINRAAAESDEATTAWAALALAPADDKSLVQARQRALAWLAKAKQGDGNELAALRLLVALRCGNADLAKKYANDLRGRQHADGGWSWAKTGPSDAFGTGQALYALSWSASASDDPAIARAVRYLLEKQRPDGSWFSPTRKPKTRDNPIAVYWGSAWATLGLARTLPEKLK